MPALLHRRRPPPAALGDGCSHGAGVGESTRREAACCRPGGLLFVWGGNLRARAAEGEVVATLARVNRLGTVVRVSALVGYGVIVLGNALR
ncbi:hypothetical protein KBZ09_15470 [Cyanobium sp. Cruz CV11-17]|jgi:hypothetical protein|uniref:hypothetical protein n=1 Tax=Cyanobium sp. Cruz CV11-17 TaxID=2823709 RepID=UPI0020CD0CA5|nr:hypothetical protein [Cyanobium sp. Cruz CV11-17]MCP9901996.1 hypothetical protein [Cyanobium sp. Cruz CV11-17]